MAKTIVRLATGDDIPELVNMHRELIQTVYPSRRIAPTDRFYSLVVDWFVQDYKVSVAENDGEILGYSLIGSHDAGGVVEKYLDAEVVFVKEAYRNTRAAYLLYKVGYDLAEELNMGIMSTSNPDSAPIVEKRGAIHTFNHYELARIKK